MNRRRERQRKGQTAHPLPFLIRDGAKRFIWKGDTMDRKIVIGNWKMNKSITQSAECAKELIHSLYGPHAVHDTDVVLTPSFLALSEVRKACAQRSGIYLGAQDVFHEPSGSYCGAVSASMLAEVCSYAFAGHSERRMHFGDTDEMVNKKVRACTDAGIIPILCIGETSEAYGAGSTKAYIRRQMELGLKDVSPCDMVVLYEPVWALGTGRTPRTDEVEEVMRFVKELLVELFGTGGGTGPAGIRTVYAGSVRPENAAAYAALPHVDGVAVGTASLCAQKLAAIIHAVDRAD